MVIYKLTCPDGKFYIGSTSNLEKRIREHKSVSKNNPKFQNVTEYISMFDFEKIKYEVIDQIDDRSAAYQLEKAHILEYKDDPNLLNKLDRPESWHKSQSEKAKKRMTSDFASKLSKKAWKNPDVRSRYILAAKERALKNPDEMRRKQKLSRDALVANRPLIKIFKDENLILETRETCKIAELLGVNQSSVCRYVNGKRKPRGYRIEVTPCQ